MAAGSNAGDVDSSEGALRGALDGPPPNQSASCTPPKTARPSGVRDRVAKGFRLLHAKSKITWGSSCRAARAFHSTGLDSMAAAIAAASAAAPAAAATAAAAAPTEKKLTRCDVKGRQKPSSSRFWLRPSEFSLLAELTARAREATATQIEGAAHAAAAAFRKQQAGLPSCAAEERPLPLTIDRSPSHQSSPRSTQEWKQSSARKGEGLPPRDAAQPTPEALIEERACTPAVVLGAPEVELGTWEEEESKEGPRGLPWRVYSVEAAASPSLASSASPEAAASVQQQGTATGAEDDVDSLPATQKTQDDRAPADDPSPADGRAAASQATGSLDLAASAACPDAAPPVSGACTPAQATSRVKASGAAAGSDAAVGGRVNAGMLNDKHCGLGFLAASEAALQRAAHPIAAAGASQAAAGAGPLAAAALVDGSKESGLALPQDNASYPPGFSSEPSPEALVGSPSDAATAARHPAGAAMLLPAAPTVIAATRAAAATQAASAAAAVAAAVAATPAGFFEGRRSMPSDGVVSPYATTPRRGSSTGGAGSRGAPAGGPPTPLSASSSASRRGRLKSTARLAASSLSRAAVEATARRFSRLPLGGEAGGVPSELGSFAASKRRRREGLASQGAQPRTCSVGSSNRSNSGEEPTRLPAAVGDGSESLHPVKRERLPSRVQLQQQQQQSQATQQRSRLLDASLSGEAEALDLATSGDFTAACKVEGVTSTESGESVAAAGHEVATARQGVSRGSPRQLLQKPRLVEAGQLKETLTRGLYGFQVEGLLWMLEREDRLPDCLSSQGDWALPEVQLSSFSDSSALKGGGVLADEPGLGKTLQMISLIAATARTPGVHAAAAPQQQTDQPEGEEGESRTLVLLPASLVPQWEAEIHRACGFKLGVLNVPRRLKETGSVLSPSALKGVQVVLVSYEALLSVACLCRPPVLPRDNIHARHRPLQQEARRPVAAPQDGLEEDPVYALVASSASAETSGGG
ncbi:hypothetical protein ACSSS7_001142 [Eimeria intestinalis]